MKIIGLAGPAGSGKDTVSAHLRDHRGFAILAFADPIRSALIEMFLDVLPIDAFGAQKELPLKVGNVELPSPRRLMQTLGTEWGRQLVHPDLWVLLADQGVRAIARAGYTSVVISDVRFDNEADWVRASGGVIWHIERSNRLEVAQHVSETGIARRVDDEVLHNDSSKDSLYAQVQAAYQRSFF